MKVIDSQPNLMTPIGIAIDDADQIYVLESHTHTPEKDYPGPKFDRIKRSRSLDANLEPNGWEIFADSIEDGMNLYCHDQYLYLVEKNKVWRYTIAGSKMGQRELLLELITAKPVYDHAALLGVTISTDRWLYVSRGNVGGQRWHIVGRDTSTIEGFGDGGNIFRCRLDGTEIMHVATGFWNPFSLDFTAEGRLFATDNDPDSRGPNRLLEIVQSGDYGYQALYGGTGIHPFLAWNGELPGTLPYAAPLGEAPTGLIDASFTNLGDRYRGQILVFIWEENNLVNIPLKSRGSSVVGQPEILIQGGEDFHPVSFAVNSHGDVYFTDWVKRQYPNHGFGRLWKLSGNGTPIRKLEVSKNLSWRNSGDPLDFSSKDPFTLLDMRRSMIESGSAPDDILDLLQVSNVDTLIQALVLSTETKSSLADEQLMTLLSHTDPEVQRMTLIYLAKVADPKFLPKLEQIFFTGKISHILFDTYLAAVKHLQPTFRKEIGQVNHRNQITWDLPVNYLRNIINNKDLSPKIRGAAIYVLDDGALAKIDLTQFIKPEIAPELAVASIRRMAASKNNQAVIQFRELISNPQVATTVRLAALLALDYANETQDDLLMSLLHDGELEIRHAAAWLLCDCEETMIVQQISKQYDTLDPHVQQIWSFCQDSHSGGHDYDKVTEVRGDAARGRAIFELKRNQCLTCHRIEHYGGTYGPDLSKIGSSKSLAQLSEAILNPSAEIAPEWQGWFLVDKEGNSHMGRQIDIKLNSALLMHENGQFISHPNPQEYGPLDVSLMPAGLENNMTLQGFADLLAYLKNLQ